MLGFVSRSSVHTRAFVYTYYCVEANILHHIVIVSRRLLSTAVKIISVFLTIYTLYLALYGFFQIVSVLLSLATTAVATGIVEHVRTYPDN